jgi:hypothetical protein
MKNLNGITYCIIAILLTAISSIVLFGCGDESVSASTLVEIPERFRGDRVEVFGEISDIETEGRSLLVALEVDDKPDLICEFSVDKPPPFQLKEGQWITISGKVDIIGEIPILRECRVVV